MYDDAPAWLVRNLRRLWRAVRGVQQSPDTAPTFASTEWRCVSMHDDAGRRGVWYRYCEEDGVLELRGGREGDDAYAELDVGRNVTEKAVKDVAAVLSYGAWMQETEGPDTDIQPFRGVDELRERLEVET